LKCGWSGWNAADNFSTAFQPSAVEINRVVDSAASTAFQPHVSPTELFILWQGIICFLTVYGSIGAVCEPLAPHCSIDLALNWSGVIVTVAAWPSRRVTPMADHSDNFRYNARSFFNRRCAWPLMISTAFQPRLKSTVSTALQPRPESSDAVLFLRIQLLRIQSTPFLCHCFLTWFCIQAW